MHDLKENMTLINAFEPCCAVKSKGSGCGTGDDTTDGSGVPSHNLQMAKNASHVLARAHTACHSCGT